MSPEVDFSLELLRLIGKVSSINGRGIGGAWNAALLLDHRRTSNRRAYNDATPNWCRDTLARDDQPPGSKDREPVEESHHAMVARYRV
jgi:hypothetical protein